MTCIIGLIHNGSVYIGGDSIAASGYDARQIAFNKVFQIGEFLIGYTFSFRLGQILEHCLVIEPQLEDESDLHYLIATFIPTVKSLFNEHGLTYPGDNGDEVYGNFLLGYRGHLYSIGNAFAVMEYSEGYAVAGCSTDYALAAMEALRDLPPKERLERAFEIVNKFSAGVLPPFNIKTIS
jgi:hypothetical protein